MLVLDEAHKLPDAARQMFGRTLSRDDVESLASGLRSERFFFPAGADRYGAGDWRRRARHRQRLSRFIAGGCAERTGQHLRPNRLRVKYRAASRRTGSDDRRAVPLHDGESDIIRYRDTDERERLLPHAAAADRTEQLDRTESTAAHCPDLRNAGGRKRLLAVSGGSGTNALPSGHGVRFSFLPF